MVLHRATGNPGELPIGRRVALGLPDDLDVKDPNLLPGVAALAGMFVEHDAGASRQYAGRVVTALGTQTISFVAPQAQGTCEVLLVTELTSQPWVVQPFATSAAGAPEIAQVMAGPVRRVSPPVFTGRPVTDFAGSLPYANEAFGVYQPLAGWLSQQSTLRFARRESDDISPRNVSEALRCTIAN